MPAIPPEDALDAVDLAQVDARIARLSLRQVKARRRVLQERAQGKHRDHLKRLIEIVEEIAIYDGTSAAAAYQKLAGAIAAGDLEMVYVEGDPPPEGRA